jgi:LPS-assembly protein
LNTGRQSGLDTRLSDYVGRVQVSRDAYAFVARGRFDQDDLTAKRLESGIRELSPLRAGGGSVIYARYAAQPETGALRPREGLSASANWS